MVDAAAEHAGMYGFKFLEKNFPFLNHIYSALIGSFGSDMIRDWLKGMGKKVMKDHMPHFSVVDPNFTDEGLHSILLQKLELGHIKALEKWLAGKTEQQRTHFIMRLLEQAVPEIPGLDPTTPEGRKLWADEAAKAADSCVSYLRYLAELDDAGRDRSVLARDFMRAADRYRSPQQVLDRVSAYFSALADQQWVADLADRNTEREQRVEELLQELRAPMTRAEETDWWSFSGRGSAPAAGAVREGFWTRWGLNFANFVRFVLVLLESAGNFVAVRRRAFVAAAITLAVILVLVLGVVGAIYAINSLKG